MRKALVAPSVGMATAPSVPASGRSILDDDGGGGSGDGGGGGGGGGGGDDGSGGGGDGDDDDAQIRKDECAMGCGNSPPCISDRDSHAIVPSGEFTSPWTPHARAKSTCMGAARSRNDGNETLQNNVVRK